MKPFHLSWQLMLALAVAVVAWWPATVQINRSAHVYSLEKSIASYQKTIDRELLDGDYAKATQLSEEMNRLSLQLFPARQLASRGY